MSPSITFSIIILRIPPLTLVWQASVEGGAKRQKLELSESLKAIPLFPSLHSPNNAIC